MAGEHSTTEPSMLNTHKKKVITCTECLLMRKRVISERAGPVAENSPVLVFEIKEKTCLFCLLRGLNSRPLVNMSSYLIGPTTLQDQCSTTELKRHFIDIRPTSGFLQHLSSVFFQKFTVAKFGSVRTQEDIQGSNFNKSAKVCG